MSRVRAADQLRALQARQAQLRQELTELSASKRALLLRNALLSCWCDALSYIQWVGSIQQPEGPAYLRDAGAGRFEQLLAVEVQLLQQLTTKGGSLGSHVSLEQLLQPDSDTIAPCTDPMAYLQHFVDQTPTEQDRTMDAAALAGVMQRTAQAVSIKLHQLESVAPWERAGVLKQMADTWETYMACHYRLIMSGRQSVVEEALAINLETMQPQPAEAAAHQSAQAAVLVPLLRLTEQQQEIVSVGMGLYYDLLAVIHHERQDINSQMSAVNEAAADSGEAGSPSSRASSNRDSHLQDLPDRRELLQKQEALTNRLDLLLHKEYKLRLAAMGWFIGSLNYEQLSRLAVMSWPYGMRVLFLGTEIMQQSRSQTTLELPKRKSSCSSG